MATIMGGLVVGLPAAAAAEFSFYLAIPTICGAGFVRLWKHRDMLNADNAILLGVGFVVSFAVAWVVIQTVRGAVWLRQFGDDLPSVGAVTPHAYALFAGALAVAVLLAFPVFLLVWLSRPAVRAGYERWAS